MSQAIQTKYLGPSNVRGSRVKATADRGSIILSWDDRLNSQQNHIRAAQEYATRAKWSGTWHGGGIGSGYVCLPTLTPPQASLWRRDMPRPSIEYMNARRECRAATGGTNYAARQLTQAAQAKRRADENARILSLDAIDHAHECVHAEFAEFRSWFRNLPSVAQLAAGDVLEF